MASSSVPQSSDAATRSTDTDALVSRTSAASLGYILDPYSCHLLPPSLRRSTDKRPPLINLGTHARTWAVDHLVRQFLLSGEGKGKGKQVLSLGAGTDTRFWRFRDEWERQGWEWECRKWVEVDFEEATASKARSISGKLAFKSKLGGEVKIAQGGTALHSPLYSLLPTDLRSLPTLSSSLSPILDPSIPTLLLAECVLIYLPPSSTSDLLHWFAETFVKDGSAAVSYDPFGLQDNFGQVMIRNLATRNLSLPAAPTTPTLNSLSNRLIDAGFSSANSLSIAQIREGVLPKEEAARVAKIEQIDEVEELNLVLQHYAVTWGSLGGGEGEVGEVVGLRMR
ncbi:leucine carboxyl methyltransferase 1 [Leucosporidium creatinivorum]|uniref:Leucine carboxyl methyltransferase 1 n=1 Tax=Leucosporidium creatinivorum TaxID=106004 RepID=A0A1Y2G266_9BASI|nr:leucine carboxyl methyltransferase 1 [Leucosporidium creatinivorum]